MKITSIVTALLAAGAFSAGAVAVSETSQARYSTTMLEQSTNVKKQVSKKVSKIAIVNRSAQTAYFKDQENQHSRV